MLMLIEFVKKYKHIIECKKTDATTWREKDECWSKITDEFNSQCGETYRKKKSVKTKYEDMKKNLKKKLSKNKAETFKTGGGTPKVQELTSAEEMLLSFLPSTLQGLPSIFDSDEKFDKQANYKNIETAISIADNVNEFQNTSVDQSDWIYEILDDDDNNEAEKTLSFKHIENDQFARKKRYLEETTNTLDNYLKKTKTPDVNIIEKTELALKDENNCVPFVTKKQLSSEIPCTSSEKHLQAKDILKKRVSKELKIEKLSKSSEKKDIVKLANTKEELVQLQKTALELEIHIKKENNTTQKEILQMELEITEKKLKLIKLDVQLKQLEVEIKRQQLVKLL